MLKLAYRNTINNIQKDLSLDESIALIKSLKKDLQIQRISNINVKNIFGKSINKLASLPKTKSTYFLLDTNNIAPSLSSDSKFGWNIINSTTTSTGVVNVSTTLRDIIGMRMFPITMLLDGTPITDQPTILDQPPNNVVNTFNNVSGIPVSFTTNPVNVHYNITVLIDEFSSQSCIGRDGRRFHFDLFPKVMNMTDYGSPPFNPYIEYTTDGKGHGIYMFEKPFTSVSTITLSIANPFDLILKPKQVVDFRMIIPIELYYVESPDDN